jgi:predicted nucleic acid-binding protein
MLVVDASVAIKWFVVEPGQSEARRLFASTSSTVEVGRGERALAVDNTTARLDQAVALDPRWSSRGLLFSYPTIKAQREVVE